MCNYVTEFLVQSHLGNQAESFVILSDLILSRLSVKYEGEDDNRGSGR